MQSTQVKPKLSEYVLYMSGNENNRQGIKSLLTTATQEDATFKSLCIYWNIKLMGSRPQESMSGLQLLLPQALQLSHLLCKCLV